MPKKNRKMNEQDLSELIEKWRSEKNARCMEGGTGVRRFDQLCVAIGYKDGEFFSDSIRSFLADNSGAIDALIEWIADANIDEWKENLKGELEDEDEEAADET